MYHVLFSIYRLFGKNLIFVVAFILDVGRVIFGRGCTKLGFFVYILIDLSNETAVGCMSTERGAPMPPPPYMSWATHSSAPITFLDSYFVVVGWGGWVMKGWGGVRWVGHEGVGWGMVGWVGHEGEG